MRELAPAPSVHAAWQVSRLPISLRGAFRWLARWRLLTTHVRARLGMVADPPGKTGGQPDPLSLQHFIAAFPEEPCPIAAFQGRIQMPITG